jgi:hypothetical protein
MEVISVLSDTSNAQPADSPPKRPESPFRLLFPRGLVEAATRHLQVRGSDGCEELVLFAGVPVGGEVLIPSLLLPQTNSTWGHVEIVKSEQPLISDWLVTNKQLLFVESHTHGGRSRWSTKISGVDVAHPVSVRNGFLTVIVPAYAEDGIDFMEAGVWECRQLKWRRLTKRDVTQRFAVVPDEEVRLRLG